MKSIFIKAAIVLSIVAGLAFPQEAVARKYANRAERIVSEIHNPNSKYVVVISHRGDWRNYPENSIPAIESVIRMGVDVMELDLKKTKDGVLVLSHDKTLDRCTNGKGPVSDYTLAEIKQLCLKRAHGVTTDSLHMPTLEEALAVCKDRIVVNVDQGFEFYDEVLAITEKLGVTDQILIKGNRPLAYVSEKFAPYSRNMMYMPIVNIQSAAGKELFEQYLSTGTVPLAYEVCWRKYGPEVQDCFDKIASQGSKLWVNTIWGSLCGYLDDDKALAEDVNKVYDKVLSYGTSMIQTDRPEQLIRYLHKRHRHTKLGSDK